MKVIVKNPDILGGTPVFRWTLEPVQSLFDDLEDEDTLEDFLQAFPAVTRETAGAALEEAQHLLPARSSPLKKELARKAPSTGAFDCCVFIARDDRHRGVFRTAGL